MPETRSGEHSLNLAAHHGCLNHPVHEAVLGLCKHAPELVWREPVPTRNRLEGFAGLWPAALKSPAGLPDLDVRLDEAKLFWRQTNSSQWIVVHLVSNIYGSHSAAKSRCAVFWEQAQEEGPPNWRDAWLASVLPNSATVSTPATLPCWSKEQDVLTLADVRRYGLPEDLIPNELAKLLVTEYFSGNELVLWHLSLPESAYSKTQERSPS